MLGCTCGRRERPPALCAVWAWYPLAYGRVPSPPFARCGMGRFLRRTGERRGAAVSVASVRRTQETRLGAGGGGFCRWVAWYILGYMRRVMMRYGVACRVWDGISWDRPAVGAGLPRPRRVRPPLAPWGRDCPVPPRVSVASVQRMRETRLAAPGGGFCRWVAWYILGYMRRVMMRYGVACRVWDGISWDRPAVGAGLPRPRRVRPLPSRQARHRARRSRHGGGAAPCTPRAMGAGLPRARRAQAFRAAFRRKKRGMFHPAPTTAGPPARTSRQRFGGPQPSK